jgi:hypothetical protein
VDEIDFDPPQSTFGHQHVEDLVELHIFAVCFDTRIQIRRLADVLEFIAMNEEVYAGSDLWKFEQPVQTGQFPGH